MSDLIDVMCNGGLIKVSGVQVLFDNINNLNYYGKASGYFIIDANGNKVYFKCRERGKAQEVADYIFGKGKYFVRDKI